MRTIIFLLLTACLSGCFEIREEVNMKADGSGEVQFVVNLSQSKDKVRTYMTMDQVEGYKVPKMETVEAYMNQAKLSLGNVKGISNVMTKSDWSSYIFTVTCRFAHVEALNEAIRTLSKQPDFIPMKPVEEKNFSYNNTLFQRFFNYPAKPKEFQELPSMQRYMLETAKMISIYRFERSIRNFSNKKAQLSPSGKAIMLQTTIADLAKGTATLANTIGF
jgi:hypothetical protein